MKKHQITVVGAANVDVGGKSFSPLLEKDSNPGIVTISPGGVGRNIAHNLALFGNEVRFISALGSDAYAKELEASCDRLSIDLSASLRSRTEGTSTYLFIADTDGDMKLAVSDMRIYDRMTPEFLETRMDLINASELCVVDTNIPEETIAFLAEHCEVPLYAEPVSMAKAGKLKKVLSHLHAVTPNYLEAGILADVEVDPEDEGSLRNAAERILSKGTKSVVITVGARGALCMDQSGAAFLPPLPGHMENGTGCGDALMSGIVMGYLEGCDLTDSLRLGMAAATCTLETKKTNNDEMTWNEVLKRAGKEGI